MSIGNILGTLGSVAGSIVAPGIGTAIGGALGTAAGDAIGGDSSGASSAIQSGLSAAQIQALGQQAATGDANEVASLVNTAQGAVGNNTSSTLQNFLKLAEAYGTSPALASSVKPAQLGATPVLTGIGSNATVAPAGGATAAPGSLSGAITPAVAPSATGSGGTAAALAAAGGSSSPTAAATMTPAQTAAVNTAVSSAIANMGSGGSYQQYHQDIMSNLTASGAFTPTELSSLNQPGTWLASAPAGTWSNKNGGNTAAFTSQDTGTLDTELAGILASQPAAATTTTTPSAATTTNTPVTAPAVTATPSTATATSAARSPLSAAIAAKVPTLAGRAA